VISKIENADYVFVHGNISNRKAEYLENARLKALFSWWGKHNVFQGKISKDRAMKN